MVRLFNPRTDRWDEHSGLDSGKIVPLSALGRVIGFLLKLNLPERIEIRRLLIQAGRYPG